MELVNLLTIFIDFETTFDGVDRNTLWKILHYYGMPEKRRGIESEEDLKANGRVHPNNDHDGTKWDSKPRIETIGGDLSMR